MDRKLLRIGVALLSVVSLLPGPLLAQDQKAGDQAAQGQTSTQPGAQAAPSGAVPPRSVDLKLDYSTERKWFPDIRGPYTPMRSEEPSLTNSPRIEQLLRDGKLMLGLQDAISLALENNLAIDVERYTPWLDEVSLLRAKSGINGLVPFDPTVTSNLNIQDSVTPLNNPFFAGFLPTAATIPAAQTPPAFVQHIGNVNFQYNQYFPTGTQFQAGMTNNRTSSNFGFFNLYNPDIQSALTVTITQPLLRGFGILPNTRLIIEAKRTIKVGLSQLEQQVMATTTQVSNDYWELVYSRENVKVQEAAVEVSQRLYEENAKRLQIGTLSSLDVLTAQSQLASDKQALVQAQSVQLQDETTLLNDITMNPLDGPLLRAEIIPTTAISTPDTGENVAIEDAVKEAWQKRPELKQAQLNLENAGTDVKATKNELLPSVNIFGQYTATGLGGVQNALSTTPTGAFLAGLPVVDSAGVPIPGLFQSTAVTTSVARRFSGRGGARSRPSIPRQLSVIRGRDQFDAADSQPRGASGQRPGVAHRAAAKNPISPGTKRHLRQRAQRPDRHAGRSRLARGRGRGAKAGRAIFPGRAGKIPAGSVHELQRRAAVTRRHFRRGRGTARPYQLARRRTEVQPGDGPNAGSESNQPGGRLERASGRVAQRDRKALSGPTASGTELVTDLDGF